MVKSQMPKIDNSFFYNELSRVLRYELGIEDTDSLIKGMSQSDWDTTAGIEGSSLRRALATALEKDGRSEESDAVRSGNRIYVNPDGTIGIRRADPRVERIFVDLYVRRVMANSRNDAGQSFGDHPTNQIDPTARKQLTMTAIAFLNDMFPFLRSCSKDELEDVAEILMHTHNRTGCTFSNADSMQSYNRAERKAMTQRASGISPVKLALKKNKLVLE